jgi:phage-related protein (TIGR01555 family)
MKRSKGRKAVSPVSSIPSEIKSNSMSDLVDALAPAMGEEISRPLTIANNLRYSAISTNRPLLSAMYIEHGILRCVIDQPVADAFRGGLTIRIDEVDDEDLAALNQFMESSGVLNTFQQAIKWARLFGGAGLIINTGQQDKPLDIESVNEKTDLQFVAADRWELMMTSVHNFMDQLSNPLSEYPYNYYGHKLHRSSVLRFEGKQAPSMQRMQFMGWGMSEFEALVQSFNSYQKNTSVVYECLDEHKVDIFKINGFNSAMATKAGVAMTTQRIKLANQLKNYKSALIVDKEDDVETKSMSFGGLAEILNEIRKGIAADCRIPITKLFGISAAGFNSGEDDLESYNAFVEAEIREKVRPQLNTVIKICCAKVFGYVPDNVGFEFKPLRVMSSRDESELKSAELNRIISLSQSGIISNERAAEMINAAKLTPLKIDENEVMSREELSASTQGQDPTAEMPQTPEGDTML